MGSATSENRPSRQERGPVTGAELTLGYVGVMAIIIGIMIMTPILSLLPHPHLAYQAIWFLLPGSITVVLGLALWAPTRGREHARMATGQDATFITLTWLLAMVAGAFPFLLSGACTTFTQAAFETISGLSTTTFTMINVDQTPDSILFYRSVLLFFGGIGLVLIMISAVSDSHDLRIYTQEGHSNRLLPNMVRSARIIIAVYATITVVGTLALVLAGMDPFDALNHAIGAVATGGFSTHGASVGFYDSLAIETILVILMILGGTNPALHMLFITGRRRAFFRDSETRAYFATMAIGALIVFATLMSSELFDGPLETARAAVFQVVSAETTTGFQTVDTFANWPSTARLVLLMLMVFGAETDSTGGGIKQWRVAVLGRSLFWEVRNRVSSRNSVHSNKVNRLGRRQAVSDETHDEVLAFAVLYLVALIAGTFIYTLFGYSLGDSLFHYASTLSTVGLGMGITPADASPIILWTTTIGMFIGRLEFYPVFVSMARAGRLISTRRV